MRVALIGCGDIAGQYLAELTRHPSAVGVQGLMSSVASQGAQVAMTTAQPLGLAA